MKRSFQVPELSKGLGRGRARCIAWPHRQQQNITASRVRNFILQADVWIHWGFFLGRLMFLADEIWSACCDSRAFICSCFVLVTTASLVVSSLYLWRNPPTSAPEFIRSSGWVTVHAFIFDDSYDCIGNSHRILSDRNKAANNYGNKDIWPVKRSEVDRVTTSCEFPALGNIIN